MTLSDAIARTDALRPNSFTRRQKLDWLSALDGAVMAELINTHEGGEWGERAGHAPARSAAV